jgi:hypothetical protein
VLSQRSSGRKYSHNVETDGGLVLLKSGSSPKKGLRTSKFNFNDNSTPIDNKLSSGLQGMPNLLNIDCCNISSNNGSGSHNTSGMDINSGLRNQYENLKESGLKSSSNKDDISESLALNLENNHMTPNQYLGQNVGVTLGNQNSNPQMPTEKNQNPSNIMANLQQIANQGYQQNMNSQQMNPNQPMQNQNQVQTQNQNSVQQQTQQQMGQNDAKSANNMYNQLLNNQLNNNMQHQMGHPMNLQQQTEKMLENMNSGQQQMGQNIQNMQGAQFIQMPNHYGQQNLGNTIGTISYV